MVESAKTLLGQVHNIVAKQSLVYWQGINYFVLFAKFIKLLYACLVCLNSSGMSSLAFGSLVAPSVPGGHE